MFFCYAGTTQLAEPPRPCAARLLCGRRL